MNNPIRNITMLLSLLVFAFGLGACNTMKGVGKDTEKAGEKIQKEAGRHTDDDDRSGSRAPR